jgi:integrase
MPHHKLTDTFVKNAPSPTEGQIDYFDPTLPGFSLRVTSTGVKTWTLFYRVDGKQVRQSLGRYPAVTLAGARTKAGAVQDLLDAGKDPRIEAERERRESAEARANTVQSVADRFFVEIGASEGDGDKPKRKGRRGKVLKTAKEVKRTLDRFLLANFGKQPIGDVTRRELIALFDDIADDNGPIAANRALAWVKRFFKWAVSKDYIDANPAADIVKPGEERKGDRVLSDAEIKEVWAAADNLGYPYGHYVKALLLTGRRRTSVASMRRLEIDATRRVWKPSGGTDNKQQPDLPLSSALETLLADIPEQKVQGGDYLFSTRLARDTALNSFTAVKDGLDEAIAKARKEAGIKQPMSAWELQHDIRRTVKTRMAELGVPKEIRDLIMGHARQGMDAVYDHSERREEKRAGLERWGRHLAGIVEGKPANVRDLRSA